MKPVATSTKELDDTRIARQLSHTQLLESLHGSMNCLLGRFKTAGTQPPTNPGLQFPPCRRRHPLCFVLFESDRLTNYVASERDATHYTHLLIFANTEC